MNNKLKGIILMLISALTFSLMQIVIAKTADRIPLFEQMFFRNILATAISYASIRKLKIDPLGDKVNRKLLVYRSIFGYLGMVTLFYATANAAQGDVAILNKMSPFVVTVLAFLFLKEHINKYQIVGLLLAFLGSFFVSNPSFNSDIFPLFVAILSAIFAGIAYALVGALKGKEHPSVIIFFFSAFSTVVTTPIMFIDFVIPTLNELLLLILIGVLASIGQITLTNSYAIAKASEVSIFNYSGIVFSMILGLIFLGQPIKFTSFIGGILVITAGIVVLIGSRKKED